MGINLSIITGNLGADPKVGISKAGKAWANLSIGSSSKGADGTKYTTWVSVAVFGYLAERAKKLKKGDMVFASGPLSTSSFENAQGQKQYKTQIMANVLERMDKLDMDLPLIPDSKQNPFEDDLPF